MGSVVIAALFLGAAAGCYDLQLMKVENYIGNVVKRCLQRSQRYPTPGSGGMNRDDSSSGASA